MSHAGWGVVRFKQGNQCGHPERRHYAKGLCRECYQGTDQHKQQRHDYYKRNRERYRQYHRDQQERWSREAARYGVSREALRQMWEAQDGKCAICGDPPQQKRLAVDHCHATGKVRALLCHRCNGAVGMMRDDPALLERAAQYIRDHHNDSVQAAPVSGRAA